MAAGAPQTQVLLWLNKTARETLWQENAMVRPTTFLQLFKCPQSKRTHTHTKETRNP